VEGSRNLPLHELVTHAHHAPDGELWVHCASGYRAAIAASLLARARFPVVLVDDEFDRAAPAGMKIVTS
jgi:rhodanese-related sulfurtransferase